MLGRLAPMRNRAARELRDLAECVLLPGLAALLPWAWAFAVFQQAARWTWLYRSDTTAAVAQALAHGACSAEQAERFAWERRLVQLVDHADHYLFRSRSRHWMARHVDVRGAWQEADRAGMLWTLHWGAGMWALCHAREAGMRAQMVLAAPQGPDFAGRRVFGRYVRARMRSVELALGRPTVFVPGGMAAIRAAIARAEQLVVVMDVPEDRVGPVRLARLRGRSVSVPAALPDMAAAQGLPVTVFNMGLDVTTGRRHLHILSLGVQPDAQALSDALFAQLDTLLQTRPAAWHLWSQAARFFRVRGADNTASSSSSMAGL